MDSGFIQRIVRHPKLWCAVGCFVLLLLGMPLLAQSCGGEPHAVDDTILASDVQELVDVLANDTQTNGQLLRITSLFSNTCPATLSQDFGLVTFVPTQPIVEDCSFRYQIRDETHQADSATVLVIERSTLFADGFESGTTQAWSFVCPGGSCAAAE